METLLEGKPRTPFLKAGDVVRIEMLDADGRSIFGAIEQRVASSGPAALSASLGAEVMEVAPRDDAVAVASSCAAMSEASRRRS